AAADSDTDEKRSHDIHRWSSTAGLLDSNDRSARPRLRRVRPHTTMRSGYRCGRNGNQPPLLIDLLHRELRPMQVGWVRHDLWWNMAKVAVIQPPRHSNACFPARSSTIRNRCARPPGIHAPDSHAPRSWQESRNTH